MRKLSFAEVEAGFVARGWSLMSTEYKGSQNPLQARCPSGHEITITWNNFHKGQGCGVCAGNVKFTIEQIQKVFAEGGCTLLDTEYTSSSTPMRYVCQCGRESKISVSHFQIGRRCQKCKGKTNSEKLKMSDAELNEFCQKQGTQFVRAWIEKKRTRIEYICKCGMMSEAYWTNFKRCPNCKRCGAAKISGDKCWMYDPDREAVALRKKFRKRCGNMLKRCMDATDQQKLDRTHVILDYTPAQLQAHITGHPNWSNCEGHVWHIDHIFPVQAFLDHGILDLKLINRLDNLRPLLGKENLSKADVYDKEEFEAWLKLSLGALPS
jgi:hypothetical protein